LEIVPFTCKISAKFKLSTVETQHTFLVKLFGFVSVMRKGKRMKLCVQKNGGRKTWFPNS
jgi:hypothetical protein